MPVRRASLRFPGLGLVESTSQEDQPPGSAVVARNVRPYDPRTQRDQGSQRAGFTRAIDEVIDSGLIFTGGAAAQYRVTQSLVNEDGTLDIDEDFAGTGALGSDWSGDDFSVSSNSSVRGLVQDDSSSPYDHGPPERSSDVLVHDIDSLSTGSYLAGLTLVDAGEISDNDFLTSVRMSIDITTNSDANMTSGGGMIGFCVGFPATTYSAWNAMSDSAKRACLWATISNTSNLNQTLRIAMHSGYDSAGTHSQNLAGVVYAKTPVFAANTTYTIELRVLGSRAELLIDDELHYIVLDSQRNTKNVSWTRVVKSLGLVTGGIGGTNYFISADNFKVWSGVSAAATKDPEQGLVVVCGGNTYGGSVEAGLEQLNSLSTEELSAVDPVFVEWGPGTSADPSRRLAYLNDGRGYYYVNLRDPNNKMTVWSASGSGLPEALDGQQRARFMTQFRNRAVLYGFEAWENNWYMTRSGDWFDMNYSSGTRPALSACAGNTTNTGLPSFEITCMAPITADIMLVAGKEKMAIMVGDPMQGGVLDDLSSSIGIVGPMAWCVDNRGLGYVVSRDGLYMANGRDLQKISELRLDRFFESIDHARYWTKCVWNQKRDGIHIFFFDREMMEPTSRPTHVWWDRRKNTFSMDDYPTAMGPTMVFPYQGGIMIGGYDGYIRVEDVDNPNDDTDAIESQLQFAPVIANPGGRTTLNAINHLVMGEGSDSVDIAVRAGRTSRECRESNARFSGIFRGAGLQRAMRRRIGNRAISIELSNTRKGEHWTLEKGIAEIEISNAVKGRRS